MADAEVLVVGGGPAGSSVAFALAKAGVDVLLVDRARFPRPKPCAEYLSPEASRILADMGALCAVEESGAAALAGIRVRAPNGAVIAGDFGAMHVERDGYVGIADVGNGLTTVALVVPASRSGEVSGDRAAFLHNWLMARPHLAPRFARAERVTPVIATGPFASHARRAW